MSVVPGSRLGGGEAVVWAGRSRLLVPCSLRRACTKCKDSTSVSSNPFPVGLLGASGPGSSLELAVLALLAAGPGWPVAWLAWLKSFMLISTSFWSHWPSVWLVGGTRCSWFGIETDGGAVPSDDKVGVRYGSMGSVVAVDADVDVEANAEADEIAVSTSLGLLFVE